MRLIIVFLYLFVQSSFAQIFGSSQVHSHNDYKHINPFLPAFNIGAGSIEVDVYLKNDSLYVAHEQNEIICGRTLEKLYLEPLKKLIDQPSNSSRTFQLLIDVKSEARATLDKIVLILGKYESIRADKAVQFVISGNRPPIEEYTNYPDFILFDYQSLANIDDEVIWTKIALISLPFYEYSDWDGEIRLSGLEYRKIRNAIDMSHRYGKPFRYWATPDTELAWELFSRMGMDFINTDQPTKCYEFLDSIKKERP